MQLLSLKNSQSEQENTCHARARMTQIQENICDSESGAFGLAKAEVYKQENT